ncbi:helix-turn-helix transcriptional regulator [Virgibacillus senegalensis]|uniref:helix-turn-helix transcriptional regulator n=1 Tax=Virgibacillus senegalensis TaxID=1499679 RepID=UPI00069F86FA|nr:AraC family transcriptional regulator [Virgibacillus senegalensis]
MCRIKGITFIYDPKQVTDFSDNYFNIYRFVDQLSFKEVIAEFEHYDFAIAFSYEKDMPPYFTQEINQRNIPFLSFLGIEELDKPSVQNMVQFIHDGSLVQKFVEEETTLFEDTLSFINRNLFEPNFTLWHVCSEFHLSEPYYSKLFKKKMGKGFKAYLIYRRMEKAMFLLQEGYSVTDVCYEIGYSNLSYFTRIFKEHVGITPSKYKKSKGVLS